MKNAGVKALAYGRMAGLYLLKIQEAGEK